MTLDEANMTIDYLKEMQEEYIEGEGYERHPLPEWYALDKAIEVIEQTTWIPVSERLPEDVLGETSDDVLIYVINPLGESQTISTGFYGYYPNSKQIGAGGACGRMDAVKYLIIAKCLHGCHYRNPMSHRKVRIGNESAEVQKAY